MSVSIQYFIDFGGAPAGFCRFFKDWSNEKKKPKWPLGLLPSSNRPAKNPPPPNGLKPLILLMFGKGEVVELGGIEPPTSTLPVPKLLVTRLHNES